MTGGSGKAAVAAGLGDLRDFTAENVSNFCGRCHRTWAEVLVEEDRSINNIRFQPYRLFNSRGHDPNNSHFACTACHDPHIELTSDASSYDANCTGCHASASSDTDSATPQKPTSADMLSKPLAASSQGKHCPVATDRCVSCHMPKVELPGAHFKFTDHRIRVVRPGDPYPF